MGEKVASIPITPPVEPLEKAAISFEEIINKSVSGHYCPNLKQFISKAEVAKLNICDLERHLNCLVKANLLTESEQNTHLFIYSCKIGLEAWGEVYLEGIKGNRSQLLFQLLRKEMITPNAIPYLVKQGIDLQKSEATVDNVFLLINHGISPNLIKLQNVPVLLWAASIGDEALVKTVCAKGVQIQPDFLYDKRLISFFAKLSQVDAIKITASDLLQKLHALGASIELYNVEFFQLAVRNRESSLVRLLLQLIKAKDVPIGYNPLHIACRQPDSLSLITIIFDRDEDLEGTDEKLGQTPFHIAIEADNVAVADLFIDRGAKKLLHQADKKGVTPFALMMQSKLPETRQLALKPSLQQLALWPGKELVATLKKLHLNEAPSKELCSLLEWIIANTASFDPADATTKELFFQLLRLHATSSIKKMLACGFTLIAPDKTGKSVLKQLCEAKMSSVILFLLQEQLLSLDVKIDGELQLLFWAFQTQEEGFLQSLDKLGIDYQARGKDQQTLLHAAVNTKNLKATRLLLSKKIDVNALDLHKRSALYYALYPLQVECVEALLTAGATPFFLADRFFLYSTFMRQDKLSLIFQSFALWHNHKTCKIPFLQHLGQIGSQAPHEAVEILFLLGTSQVNPASFFSSKEAYLKVLFDLQKKYPQASLEYFYPLLLQLNPIHMQRKINEFAVPEVEEEIPLNELLLFFDSLNWNDPLAPDYCDPQKVLVYGLSQKRETLRSSLQAVVGNYVPNRLQFTGTPLQGTPELAIFYKNLENILKNIVLLLRNLENPLLYKKAILKLAWSTVLCGTRWEETALRVFHKLKYPKSNEERLEEKYDSELAKIRENIARLVGHHSMHGYRQVVRWIGNEFNIPMSKGIPNVSEPCELRHLTPDYCRHAFRFAYLADLIVPFTFTFFESSLKKNDGVLIRWCKNHVPDSFAFEEYQALSFSTACIPLFYTKAKEKQAALQHLFATKGIPVPEHVSADEALKSYLGDEYVEQRVFDFANNKIRMSGVIDFLKQRQVLTEPFENLFMDFYTHWHSQKAK